MEIVFVEEKIISDNSIHHIIDNIYLGNKNGLYFLDLYNIFNIIEIGEEYELEQYNKIYHSNKSENKTNNINKLTIKIKDNRNININQYFETVWNYINLNKTNNILVHCNAGTSRSVSFVISYLIKYKNMSLEEATHFIKNIRQESIYTKPNIGFIKQLKSIK